MIRKLAVSVTIAAAAFGMFGASEAGALTLPPGDGAVQCGIGGTARVVRPISNPSIWKIVVAGKIAGCTYNGNPIPLVTGATRSVAINNPTAVCAALADGSATARTTITVKINGVTYTSVAVNVELSVSPSSPGSRVQASGAATVNGIALNAGVDVQTDRPASDLCNGATKLTFLGSASLNWDRP